MAPAGEGARAKKKKGTCTKPYNNIKHGKNEKRKNERKKDNVQAVYVRA